METKEIVRPTAGEQRIMQLVIFRVGDEEFGVPIGAIKEIIKIGKITPIPDSPEFIKGLINVRGDVVATIDVRARFFLTFHENAVSKHIVITKQEDSLFGLMVDEVMEVLRIQEADIKAPPPLITKIHEDYVSGVLTHEDRLIILLDLAKVLSENELTRLSDITRRYRKKIREMRPEQVAEAKFDTRESGAENSKKRDKSLGKRDKTPKS